MASQKKDLTPEGSQPNKPMLSGSDMVSDENRESSSDEYRCSDRPSFYKYNGSTGLKPTANEFDPTVCRNLYELLEQTTTELINEERLKTFLRVRPSTKNGCPTPRGMTTRSGLALKEREKGILILNDTTVLANPTVNTVSSFPGKSKVEAERRKKMEFNFNKVFGPETSQSTIFEECVMPLIDHFVKSENCLIFTYGSTNSGKTYTLQGHGVDYGIIPRTLDALFTHVQDRIFKQGDIKPHLYESYRLLSPKEKQEHLEKKRLLLDSDKRKGVMEFRINRNSTDSTTSSMASSVHLADIGGVDDVIQLALFQNTTVFSVWVSYAELYNEKVYDLLETVPVGSKQKRKELKLLQDKEGFVYIRDLTEIHVTSENEAYQIYLAGRNNLRFAATQMNEHSSRSHSFFTIRVVTIGIGDGHIPYPKSVHRMTFCDLAGMERVSQTENEGHRLKESNNINLSLTVLLKVIRLLRAKQATGQGAIETIPFRESKLTHIFKSYFCSSTHICMIVNVNPDPKVIESTCQVLHNSAIASNVVVFRPTLVVNERENQKPKTKCMQQKANTKTGNGTSMNKPRGILKNRNENIATKPPSSQSERESPVELPTLAFESLSTSPDSSVENAPLTVVPSTKLLHVRIAALEAEVEDLRGKLAASELRAQQMRDYFIDQMAEERRILKARYEETRQTDEFIAQRRLSNMKSSTREVPGPVTRFAETHSPPKVYMESILEDEDDSDTETP